MLLRYSRIKRKLKKSNRIHLHKLKSKDREMITKVTKSLGVFRVNSFDTEVIIKDLIGMAKELELRGSSLEEEIGDDLNEYVNHLVENSKGAYPLEYSTYFGKRIFGGMLIITFFVGLIEMDGDWRGPLPVIIFYFALMAISELYHGIIAPNYKTQKGLRKRIPDLIYGILLIPLIWITLPSSFSADFPEVNLQVLSLIFGGIYVISKLGYLWAQKLLIQGREYLAEEY